MATRTSSSTRARGGTSSRPANRRPQTRSAPRKGAKKPQGGGLPLADGLALELRLGRETLAVAMRGAARFAAGEGRHGEGV